MKQGDIILIKFPFTDLSATKVRPALVLSSAQYNRGDDAIFVLITSKKTNINVQDYLFKNSDPEFRLTGLKGTSVFRVSKIHTLSKSLAKRKLGKVGPQILGEIKTRIRDILDL